MNRVLVAVIVGALMPAAASAAPQSVRPRTLTVEIDPKPHNLARDSIPAISPLIYLNRCEGGCTVTPGDDDARTNSSSIAQGTAQLTEFKHSDQVWQETVECVRTVFEPYAVDIVTEDPGDTAHHEAMVAGTSEELGYDPPPGSTIGGVGPSTCEPLDNVISFTFANTYQDDVVELCWTIAQESAHAFGLDHELDCADPMTYIPGCGTKYFRDEQFRCGETEARECRCGGTTQNSHKHLTEVFGEGTLPDPPAVEILNAEAVASGVANEVAFTASHPRGIGFAELYVNGALYKMTEGNDYGGGDDYRIAMPQHPDGVLNLEIVAYNDLEVPASATAQVTRGEPCSSAGQCFDGMECRSGACTWPAPSLALGEPCDFERQCMSGLCPSADDGERYCSKTCVIGLEQCPSGMECLEAGSSGACWPVQEGGCGCSASGRGQPALPLLSLGLLLGGVYLSLRRRA